MGMMSEAPSSERVQIGFFGIRNAGKSSVVNAVTGQNLSVIPTHREQPQIRSARRWKSPPSVRLW